MTDRETDNGLNHPDYGIATMPGEDRRTMTDGKHTPTGFCRDCSLSGEWIKPIAVRLCPLHAAAPEMLEALQAIADEPCDHGPTKVCPRETARAALAKALRERSDPRALHMTRQQAWSDRRRAEGRCIHCGQRRTHFTWRCDRCQALYRQRHAKATGKE